MKKAQKHTVEEISSAGRSVFDNIDQKKLEGKTEERVYVSLSSIEDGVDYGYDVYFRQIPDGKGKTQWIYSDFSEVL